MHALVLALIGTGASLAVLFPNALSLQSSQPSTISGLSIPSIGASRQQEPVLTSSVLTNTVRRDELEDGLRAFSGDVSQAEAAGAAGEAAAEPVQPFLLHTVLEGETASAIAARYGIDLQFLLAANPDLRDGELLSVGQVLFIPPGNGALYHVRYGETLSDVAARFGVSVEAILGWPANGISSPDQVGENQLVFVPGANVAITVAPEPTPAPAPVAVVEAPPPSAAPAPVVAAEPVAASSGLVWPVTGPISSYMDGSHPLGIDIDLFNNPNAAIVAATSGTVTFAGGNPCCSYGLYVVILSPNGIETLYAHLSSISVSVGQTISQGQVLGYAGCTGYCTGNHLHFEVIDNGVRVNPLNYLP